MDSFNNSTACQEIVEPESACLPYQGPGEQESRPFRPRMLGKGRPAALQKIKRSESSGSLPSPSQDHDQIQIQQQVTSIHRTTSLLNFKDNVEPMTQKAHKSTVEDNFASAVKGGTCDMVKNTSTTNSQDLYSNPSTRANTQTQAVKSQVNAASLSDEKVDSQVQNANETFSDYKSTPSRAKDLAIGGSSSRHGQQSLVLSNKGHSDFVVQPMSILDCSLGASGGESDLYNAPNIPDEISDLERQFHEHLDSENMKQINVEKFLRSKNKFESTEVLRAFRERKNSQLSMSSCSGSKLGGSSFYERRRKMQHQTGGAKSYLALANAKDQHSMVTVENPFLLPGLQSAQSIESNSTANEAAMRFKKMSTIKQFESQSQNN